MRWNEIIDNKLTEGDVVSLGAHKVDKAVGEYTNALQGIYKGESDFFKSGKFLPFAESYIKSGFNKDFAPQIIVDVNFRDVRLNPAARELVKALRGQRFKIQPASGHAPPFARKTVDLNTAKALFAEREQSPIGAYQPSRSGFRTAYQEHWNDAGVGFNISVGGMDSRRGERGNNYREEYHIIDDDKDMAEVAQTYALIQRAKIKGV